MYALKYLLFGKEKNDIFQESRFVLETVISAFLDDSSHLLRIIRYAVLVPVSISCLDPFSFFIQACESCCLPNTLTEAFGNCKLHCYIISFLTFSSPPCFVSLRHNRLAAECRVASVRVLIHSNASQPYSTEYQSG